MSDRWRDDGQVVYRRKAKENKMLRAVQGNREEGSGQRKFSQMRKRRGKWRGDTTITFLITVTKDLTRSNSRNESPAWGPWMVEEIAARWLLVSGACGRCLLASQSIGSREIWMMTFIWLFLLSFFVFCLCPQPIGYCYSLSGVACDPFWVCLIQCVS